MGVASTDQAASTAVLQRDDNRGAVKRVLLIALAVNVSMTVLKLVIGLLTGSLAVLADAMHSATDGLSSLLGLITNGLSDPSPDRDHPYGHDKYEGLGALAIAGFILFTAFEILKSSLERIAAGLPPLRLDGHDLLLLLIVLVLPKPPGTPVHTRLAARKVGRLDRDTRSRGRLSCSTRSGRVVRSSKSLAPYMLLNKTSEARKCFATW